MNDSIAMTQLKSKGLSYGAIALQFGVSRQRVHQLISGYKGPSQLNRKTHYVYEFVMERDGYKCQKCGATANVIHHRDGDDRNNVDSNLLCLCNPCHLTLHRPLIKARQPARQKAHRVHLPMVKIAAIHFPEAAHSPVTEFTIETDDLMTLPDTARELNQSEVDFYRWAERGKIIAIRLGGILFVPKSEVARLKKATQ